MIESFDSVHGSSAKAILATYNWLCNECHDHEVEFPTGWKLFMRHPGVPKQQDGSSCGIYTMAFIHAIMHGIDIHTLSSIKIERYGQ